MPSSSSFLFASAAAVACAFTASAAAAAPAVIDFNIPAGDLGASLERFAAQSRQQLLFSPGLVAGRRSPAVRGAMTADQALVQLLAGSGITVQRPRAGVVVLHGPEAGTAGSAELPVGEPEDTLVDQVVVTGSLIRGSAAPAAPVVILKRDDIDRTGAGTLAEALNALPQAFGGSATPDTFMTGGDNNNSTAATGINLRGLGADATLVLVNGRRLAGSGAKGDFADVSSIPLTAVNRVDVLLDGASALYGSDAVGGVVNIILKTDFEGAETRLRGGIADGGVAEEFTLGQTFGFQWDGGGLLLSGEYYRRDALRRADRDYAASADLTRFGGTDHRNFLAAPGNILVFDPATSSFVVGWAIPNDQDGTALTPGDFLPGQINKGDLQEGMDLLPRQSRISLYGHLNHDLTDAITLRAEARYSDRRFDYRSTSPVTAAFVTSANPYFVSPDGSSAHLLVYSFLKEAGPARASGGSESVALSLGFDVDLPRGWRLETYAAYGRDLGSTRTENLIQNAFIGEALGSVPDQPGTAYVATTDGYLNLFGDGRPGANTQAVLDFVTSGWAERNTESAVGSVNVLADGDLWTLPGGTMKLAVGGQLRRETFDQFGVGFASTAAPNPYSEPTYERDVWAVFGEARIPLVGEANSFPGVRRLEISVAGRIEGYDDVGQTADPKLGVVWEPFESLTLRGTVGTSFRAPTLKEVYEVGEIGPATLPRGNLDVLSVVLYGGNPDLEPETATSWTIGGDWRPPAVPDLQLNAAWFDIDFEGRIGTPALENVDAALNDPALAPFVTFVDPTNPADLAKVEALINDPTFFAPGAYPANAYGAIVDARYVNTGRVRVRGLDLGARYRLEFGADTIDLAASATYLANFQRAVTPTAPLLELVDRAGQPVDWRARAAATWSHGPHQTMVAFNYVDNYAADNGKTVDAWTTVDVTWRWDLSGTFDWATGLQSTLAVQNLFDADPPFYDNVRGYGYDPANADPLGRVVSIQLSRRW